MRPNFIGIAGPSACGKSVLAARLASKLGMPAEAVVPLDAYYKDLSALPPREREKVNFDVPEAIDSALLQEHLAELSRGRAVRRPVYDFATHTRLADSKEIRPEPFLLLEGLFVLYWKPVRDLLRLKIFMEAGDEVCLARRTERDLAQRRRSRDEVKARYEATVRPMRKKWVTPTRTYAELIVSGEGNLEENVSLILRSLKGLGAGLE
jgi:uridine kinase